MSDDRSRPLAMELVQRSRLARFYRQNLKKFSFIQNLALWGVNRFLPFLMRIVSLPFIYKKGLEWRPMVRQSDYVREGNSLVIELVKPTRVEVREPLCFPVSQKKYMQAIPKFYSFPEIDAIEIANATVYGRSNLVVAGDKVICHDLYDLKQDLLAEERYLHIYIDNRKNRVRWLSFDKHPGFISVAACFTDVNSGNYAHWTTEVLPRLVLFCADKRFSGIAILIDAGLHKNIKESVLAVAGERNIIELDAWKAMNVGRLLLISSAGYVPWDKRYAGSDAYAGGKFSPDAFNVIKDKLQNWVTDQARDSYPSKIYIRRRSGTRNVINAQEVEDFLSLESFTIIEPEKLDLVNQIRLFEQAEVIVASSGAALANIIYAKPTAKIIVLMSDQLGNMYGYWQNIACAAGGCVTYVLGAPGGMGQGIHADFTITLDTLKSALAAV